MLKQKNVDIEDSNIAGLGGEADQEAREAAAATEDAWWVDKAKGIKVGDKPGIRIWRIEKFQVKKWPREQYGKFYAGDSYIVMRTYKKTPDAKKLSYDIHFWLGKECTQDEQGTAAYKTVELDDFLDQEPVQHREVQDHESDMFMSYWKPPMQIMQGGIESGFNHVKPKEYKPRLFQMKGRKNVRVSEVKLSAASLNHGDVFVLDNGLMIYQWNGNASHPNERRKGQEIITAIREERHGKAKSSVQEDGDEEAEFWNILGGSASDVLSADAGGEDKKIAKTTILFHLSDASGSMQFKKVAESGLKKSMLQSDDVMILDLGTDVYVWIGNGANKAERKSGMKYAMEYLKKNNRPDWVPITQVSEGKENAVFMGVFK